MNSYYEQLKDHKLERLDMGEFEGYIMYDPKYGKNFMGVTILFPPNGIVIQGDFAPGSRGINSVAGYDSSWFGSKKDREYLAEKFIGYPDSYEGDRAKEDWEYFQNHNWENYGDDPSVNDDLIETIKADPDYSHLDWSDKYGVFNLFEEYIDEYYDAPFGYGYDTNKLDHLCAIQQRFMELYAN